MSFSEDPTQGASVGDDPTAAGQDTSEDPTQGTEAGATAREDPMAGAQTDEPYDDPTQGSELGATSDEDPTA